MAHNRTPVTSSSIASIGFDAGAEGTGVLTVEFTNGKVYAAHGVRQADHDTFLAAPSHGAHFNQFLRKNYNFQKVGE